MNNQTKKLNTYTSEFKESAVKLAIESNEAIAQTARDLGVNPNTFFEYIEVFYNREQIYSANDVCHPLTMKYSKKLCNFVSGKVLTHQSLAVSLILRSAL